MKMLLPSAIVLCGFVMGSKSLGAVSFRHQTIDDKIAIGYGLAIADVNADRKPDILLVDKAEVVWYENPSWKKHVIAEKLTELDHVCIAAQDIDGDGKAELAIGAGWNPGDTVNSGGVLYLSPPPDRTQKWQPVQLHHEPTVHRMWWVKSGGGTYDLVVSPLHGRGNKNGAGEGVRLLQYTVPSNRFSTWSTTLIEGSMHMTHNLDPVQWDDDPAEELLYCGKEGVLLLDRSGDAWKSTPLAGLENNNGFAGAGEVRAGRLGNDRIIATIEPMHGTNAVVYTKPAAGAKLWTRHVLDTSLADGHAVACGDLKQRGLDQIVVGWRGKNAQGKVGLKIFSPKDASGKGWEQEVLDDNEMACEDLKLADLDGDGDLEVIAAGRATKNVKIYWNSAK
jgi:FG-GAP repeat